MRIEILSEHGLDQALFGLGLSYGLTSGKNFIDFDFDTKFKLSNLSKTLAYEDGGENKFLRMIQVMLDMNMPLYFWKEFDTYKVGTVAQSESTMHTVMSKPFSVDMFECDDEQVSNLFLATIDKLNELRILYFDSHDSNYKKQLFNKVIKLLPSAWLQRRIVSLNYSVLQNIFKHRHNHKLVEWRYFCEYLGKNLHLAKYYLNLEKL